jgi:hypothetical protein
LEEAEMQMQVTVDLVVMTCGECGTVYGMNRPVYDERHQQGGQFFCTNGHPRVFRETDVQRLTKELAKKDQQLAAERERAAAARAETAAAERRVSAQKAVTTRLKNKVAKGECPCCGKLFVDLHEHMKSEHPEFEQREEPVEESQ